MALIDVSIVNVALPSIREGLGASESDLQWVLSGYALTFGVILVAAGRAGDIFGRAPLFMAGVVVFTGASAWAGFASDPLWLNIARALEGVGSGLISPQVVGMIQQFFRGAERGRAFGIFGSVVGVSVAIGPVLGGLLIHIFGVNNGWRWVFFVNLPVGVISSYVMDDRRGTAARDLATRGVPARWRPAGPRRGLATSTRLAPP